MKKLKNGLRLLLKIIFTTHFFANIWVLIGTMEMEYHNTGWILDNIQDELSPENMKNDFVYLYTISVYWVITSFASVGYGEITGQTDNEYLFIMMVEMVGIGFFGYMIGTF